MHKFLQLKEVEFRIKLQKQSNRELICWSSQVADAMGFLAKNDIIHVRNFHCFELLPHHFMVSQISNPEL